MIYKLRAALCEVFVLLATRIAPKDYTPSYVEAAIDLYKLGKREACAEVERGRAEAYAEVVRQADRVFLEERNDLSDRRAVRAFADRFVPK